MRLRHPEPLDEHERPLEGLVVLRGKADDHVGGQVEAGERLEPAGELGGVVAATHRPQHRVVARLERHVQVRRHGRGLRQGCDELVGHVVHLDRREAQALQPRRAAGLADEPRQRVTGGAVAEAAEVDAGQHHLAMPLIDATTNLREHRRGGAAARCAAHERDHAERARERAAVLDLHERSDAVEPVLGVDAADRANVAGDECRGFVAGPPCDDDVRRRSDRRRLRGSRRSPSRRPCAPCATARAAA